jgi:sec-independent protein translocase protein TatB
MMDIGWSELLIIGVVALIVVGPKDLPVMFRTLGRFTAKARNMAREFQRAMDDAAKSAGVNEAMKDVRDLTSKKNLGLDALESAATKFENWKPSLATGTAAAATAAAAKAGPAAAAETPAAAAPMGPATRALAEKQAAQRSARLDRQAKAEPRAKTGPAAPEAAAPAQSVRKAVRRTPAAKAAEAALPPEKPKAKPRTRKTDQA